MELYYNCAGMCEKAPYFLFSDTSMDGLPVQSCSGPVLSQLYQDNLLMGIVFLVESFIILAQSIYLFIPFAYHLMKKRDLELKYKDLQVLIMCHYYRCGPLSELLIRARDERGNKEASSGADGLNINQNLLIKDKLKSFLINYSKYFKIIHGIHFIIFSFFCLEDRLPRSLVYGLI